MLPQYSDGSAKGKGKKVKKKKELSLIQSCILLMVLFWIMGFAGYFYRSLERMHGADANGYIGLVILGPHTRAGQQWIERCEAFFRGVEERFAVPGWSEEIEKSIGKYKEGEYLEQVRAREREITKEVDTSLGSAKFPPALTSLLSPALAKSQEHGGAAFQAGTALQKGERGGAHSSTKDPNALPEGSYKGSCDQCVLVGFAPEQQLRCTCTNGEGHGTTSFLRLSTCKNGEWVGNLDGILSCEPVPEGAAARERDRGGSHDAAPQTGQETDEKGTFHSVSIHTQETHAHAANAAPSAARADLGAGAGALSPLSAQGADAAGGGGGKMAAGGELRLSDADLHLKDHIKLREANAEAAAAADPVAQVASQRDAQVASQRADLDAGAAGRPALPRRPTGRPWDAAKTAILITVIDPDDTQALKATLESLEKIPNVRDHEIFVSQDVPSSRLNALVVKYQAKGTVVHVMLNLEKEDKALLREARHVRAAVNHVFGLKGKKGQEFERIIVFDHDLEFSPSVLSFYQTCAAVFDQDPSLFAASAWNELGLPQFMRSENRLSRDSYFSGVAWMMAKEDWSAINDAWPV